MTYQENEEAIFYSFPQFKRINYKDFILLKKNQKILFVDLNDLDQLENDIEETKIKKSSFLISLFTSVIGCSLLVLQLGYLVILKRFGFEYIHSMNQIIFNLIILCCLFINYCLIKKKKIKIQYVLIGCLGFVVISIFGFQYFQKDEEEFHLFLQI